MAAQPSTPLSDQDMAISRGAGLQAGLSAAMATPATAARNERRHQPSHRNLNSVRRARGADWGGDGEYLIGSGRKGRGSGGMRGDEASREALRFFLFSFTRRVDDGLKAIFFLAHLSAREGWSRGGPARPPTTTTTTNCDPVPSLRLAIIRSDRLPVYRPTSSRRSVSNPENASFAGSYKKRIPQWPRKMTILPSSSSSKGLTSLVKFRITESG
ncbi:hypothetical protein EJB05_57543, partial [Eragrostis curvula]